MVSTRRRTASYKALILNSALEHPLVMILLGNGRYLQAAASKSLAQVYSDRFGTSTSKSLSNEAAESGSRTFLDWTRSIGCNWNESVFLSGVKGGRTEILQHLIDNGCPVPQGETACTCAAKEGRLEALMWLRERVFAWNKEVCTEAAARGDLPFLQWARAHECAWDSNEVLVRAALGGHLSILEWGHQQGAELTAWLTAMAAGSGSLHVLDWLMAHHCPWSSYTVLNAAAHGHCNVYDWLKKNSCRYNVNAELEGSTALHCATMRGDAEFVRMLLDDGARVNQVTQEQRTALHLAAVDQGSSEIVQILVNAGAHVNVKDQDCTTPLLIGAVKGFLDVVTVLLRAGANPNHHTDRCPSPLHYACRYGHIDVARALIDWKVDVNEPNTVFGVSGVYPIHVAAKAGQYKAVAFLLKCGAEVNVTSSSGQTPLSLARAEGHAAVVEILTAAGATH